MIEIDLNIIPYNVKGGIIYISEKDTQFDTSYIVKSNKSGVWKEFKFECSTGPEFDPKTEWVYKSVDGIKLHVCNDAEMTKRNAQNYLNAKLR